MSPTLHITVLPIFLHASLADGLLSLISLPRVTVCVDTHVLVQHFLSLSFLCLLVILLLMLITRPPSGIYWIFIKSHGPPYHVRSAHCTDVMKVNNNIPLSGRLNKPQLRVSYPMASELLGKSSSSMIWIRSLLPIN